MDHHEKHEKLNPTLPTCTVVIPCLNEEDYVEDILSDVVANLLQDGVQAEIIVSDSGSTDKTPERVNAFISAHPDVTIRLISHGRKGVSSARNEGAHYATGEYLIFLDADNRVSSDFLKKTLAEIKGKKLDVAGCYIQPDSGRLCDRVGAMVVNNVLRGAQYISPSALGAAIVVRKSLFKKMGGFNESLPVYEDTDFTKRASKIGRFRMITSTEVVTSTRRLEGRRFRQIIDYVRNGVGYLMTGECPTNMDYPFGKHGTKIREVP